MDENRTEGAIGGVTGGTKMRAEGRVHEVAVEGQQKSIDAKDTSVEAGGHLLRRGCTGSWAWIRAKERNSSGAGYLDSREMNSTTEPFCYGHA